ncbi:hypothetical protein Tco_0026787 [Tanacetum coccineum]
MNKPISSKLLNHGLMKKNKPCLMSRGSIRPEGFLSSVLLWLVINVAVVGVGVTVVVVIIVAVVVVVESSFVVKVSFVIT